MRAQTARRPSNPATIRKVRVLGHVSVGLMALYVAAAVVWRSASEYDAGLNLTGPDWLLRLGGEPAPLVLGALCELAGGAAIALGSYHRRTIPRNEGLWACSVGLVATTVYVCITF